MKVGNIYKGRVIRYGDTDMIFMPIIMVAPFLALWLFYYLPFETALPIYIAVLIIAGFCYYVMIKSMRAKAKTGLEAMIGREALALENIDPEGKIDLQGEIWTAAARGKKISRGRRVRILGAKGLVLRVEGLDEEEKTSWPQSPGARIS